MVLAFSRKRQPRKGSRKGTTDKNVQQAVLYEGLPKHAEESQALHEVMTKKSGSMVVVWGFTKQTVVLGDPVSFSQNKKCGRQLHEAPGGEMQSKE